jgi:hypothetical protein
MNRNKVLETILSISLGMLVIFWVTQHKNMTPFTGTEWLLPITVLLICIGLFSTTLSEKIHWAWMKLAHAMGYVMSRVMLSIIYFFVLLPLSILSKFFTKKDALQLKKKSTSESYYIEKNHTYVAADFEEMW